MFSGIVEEVGKILNREGFQLKIGCKKVLEDAKIGDSISVNGVCLTVKEKGRDFFLAHVSQETLKRSNFSKLKIGDFVNLERSLKVGDRISGHIVQGHVDTVGKLIGTKKLSEFYEMDFSFPEKFSHLLVEKGSVALNGISLTVALLGKNFFRVAVIPHTFSETNLKYLKIGDDVNIEFDILGKYIVSFLKRQNEQDRKKITLEELKERGF